jgi:hypothetical protein
MLGLQGTNMHGRGLALNTCAAAADRRSVYCMWGTSIFSSRMMPLHYALARQVISTRSSLERASYCANGVGLRNITDGQFVSPGTSLKMELHAINLRSHSQS